jgi:magnesium transporter
MNKSKKHHYNRLFLDKLAYTGSYSTPTAISDQTFNAKDYHISPAKSSANLPALPDNEHQLWVQLSGLSTFDTIIALGKRFNINQSDLQDILTTDHITKTSITDKSILLIVKDFYYNEKKELNVEHVCLLLYQNYEISFQESNRPIFDRVSKALEENTSKVREKSIDYLFGILLDSIVNKYVEIIGDIEESLEDMEECLIDPNKADDNIGIKYLTHGKAYNELSALQYRLKNSRLASFIRMTQH